MRGRSTLANGTPLESSAFYFHPSGIHSSFSFTAATALHRSADSGSHHF